MCGTCLLLGKLYNIFYYTFISALSVLIDHLFCSTYNFYTTGFVSFLGISIVIIDNLVLNGRNLGMITMGTLIALLFVDYIIRCSSFLITLLILQRVK